MHLFLPQELEESRIRTSTTIEEVDGRLEKEYEQRLLEALREIRAQHEMDLQTVRSELEILYESKVSIWLPGVTSGVTSEEKAYRSKREWGPELLNS